MKFKTLWLSKQVWVFESSYLPSWRGCKSVQWVQECLKQKPSYKALFSKQVRKITQICKTNKRPFWSPILQNLNRKSDLWTNLFLKMILLTSQNRCRQAKNLSFQSFRKMVKNANWWAKSNLHLSQTAKFYPFLKGFKNEWWQAMKNNKCFTSLCDEV